MKDVAKKPTANQTAYMELVAEIKRKFKRIGKRGYVPLDNIYKEETPKRVLQKQLTKLKNVAENIYQFAKYYDPLKDSYIIGTERRKQERAEASRKGWETRRANEAKRRAEEILREQLEKQRADELLRKQEEEWEKKWNEPLPELEELTEEEYKEWERQQFERVEREREQRKKAREQAEKEQGLPRETEVAFQQIEDLINNWSESILWSEELKRIKRADRNTLKSVLDGAINSLGREQVIRNCVNHERDLIDIVNRVLYGSGSKYKEYSAREGVQIDINKFTEILYGRPLTVAESKEVSEMMERLNEGE